MLKNIGNFLIVAGSLAIIFGFVLKLGRKLRWIGRLPGDILIHKGNFTFYFPLATSLVLSLLLSLFLFFIFRIIGKK